MVEHADFTPIFARDGTYYLPGSISVRFAPDTRPERIRAIVAEFGCTLTTSGTGPEEAVRVPDGLDEEIVESLRKLPEIARADLNTVPLRAARSRHMTPS